MPIQRHRIKPRDALWISVEVTVHYSCESGPEVVTTKIRGLRSFAFVFGHEYDVDAVVDDWRRGGCQRNDCRSAVFYDYLLTILVSDTIGFGFGVGNWGTGTAGWSFPATEERMRLATDCICCDHLEGTMTARSAAQEPASRRANGALPLIVGLTVIAIGIVSAVINVNHPSKLGQLFLLVGAVGVTSSVVVAASRAIAYRRRSAHAIGKYDDSQRG